MIQGLDEGPLMKAGKILGYTHAGVRRLLKSGAEAALHHILEED